DYFVYERRTDLEQWTNTGVQLALDDYLAERGRIDRAAHGEGSADAPSPWDAPALARWASGDVTTQTFSLEHQNRAQLSREFDRYLDLKTVYDLVLLVSSDGHLVTCSSRDPAPEHPPLSERLLRYLFAYDYSRTDWFRTVMDRGQFLPVEHHISPFHLEFVHGGETELDAAWDYSLGFAAPVRASSGQGEVRGVLYALVNW